jgi:hypothetical protein
MTSKQKYTLLLVAVLGVLFGGLLALNVAGWKF